MEQSCSQQAILSELFVEDLDLETFFSVASCHNLGVEDPGQAHMVMYRWSYTPYDTRIISSSTFSAEVVWLSTFSDVIIATVTVLVELVTTLVTDYHYCRMITNDWTR